MANWEENKHPRDEGGKFTSKGGASKGTAEKEKTKNDEDKKTIGKQKYKVGNKEYDVESISEDGAIINVNGTSITDESAYWDAMGMPKGISGGGYSVFVDGDELMFETFDEAYEFATKGQKDTAYNKEEKPVDEFFKMLEEDKKEDTSKNIIFPEDREEFLKKNNLENDFYFDGENLMDKKTGEYIGARLHYDNEWKSGENYLLGKVKNWKEWKATNPSEKDIKRHQDTMKVFKGLNEKELAKKNENIEIDDDYERAYGEAPDKEEFPEAYKKYVDNYKKWLNDKTEQEEKEKASKLFGLPF